MCEYCDINNTEENLQGLDGIVYDKEKDKYYLYIEHFRNEINRVYGINYCLKCGRKLVD